MRFACSITKTIHTHSEYVIFIAFPLNNVYPIAPQCYIYTYVAFLVTCTRISLAPYVDCCYFRGYVLSTVCSLTLQTSYAIRLFSRLFDCRASNIRHLVMKTNKKESLSFPAGAWLWLTVTCPRRYRPGTQQLLHDQ
jgi:hypothetical protein